MLINSFYSRKGAYFYSMNEGTLRSQIKIRTLVFMTALMLSGITAIPLKSELAFLNKYIHLMPQQLGAWIEWVQEGVAATDAKYPFIAYGTDWLAYAHVMIAILFIGVIRHPVRNKWIVDWGIINCLVIFPVAFIFGHIREIPLFHIMIDCSFGIFGILLLMSIKRKIKMIEEKIRLK